MRKILALVLLAAFSDGAVAAEAVYEPETGILTIPQVRMGNQIFPNAQILLPSTGSWTLMSIGTPSYAAPAEVGSFPVTTTMTDFVGIQPDQGGVLELNNGQYWQVLSGTTITCNVVTAAGANRECLASDHVTAEVKIYQLSTGYLMTFTGLKGSVLVAPLVQPNVTRLIEEGTIAKFTGALLNSIITLDNGHRYQVVSTTASQAGTIDLGGGVLPNAKVTIYQTAPATYIMMVEGFATAVNVMPIL